LRTSSQRTAERILGSRLGGLIEFTLLASACVVLTLGQHLGPLRDLPFPPGLDQDWYLAAARDFADSRLFMWRAPLYSAWLGGVYVFTGRDFEACFYLDKTLTVGLMAFVTACLVWRLCGFLPALATCLWTLELRYLLRETNSSHTFAALLVGVALLALLSRPDVGWPWALFALFLGACARRELIAPLALLIVVGLALCWRSEATGGARGVWRHWLLCGLMAAGLWGLFRGRPSHVEKDYFGVLLFQQFSVNYVERHNLHQEFPDKWLAFRELIPRYFPDVEGPVDMIRKHPDELLRNVIYNGRSAPRALLASVFGLEHFAAVVAAVVGVICVGGRSPLLVADHGLRNLAVWTLALHVIVPVNLMFRVISRYNFVLVPTHIAWVFILGRIAIRRFRQAGRRSA